MTSWRRPGWEPLEEFLPLIPEEISPVSPQPEGGLPSSGGGQVLVVSVASAHVVEIADVGGVVGGGHRIGWLRWCCDALTHPTRTR